MTRINHFFSNLDLKALYEFIERNGCVKSYAKGEPMCEQGAVCKRVAIVRSGYFKFSVINTKGDECITGFSFEYEIATYFVNSFVFGKPSYASITAGCDCEVIEVRLSQAREHMMKFHSDFIGYVSTILLKEAYRRYLDLHVKTPAERYVELISRSNKDLLQIPLQEIASYLSISRRQLQRIREKTI